MVNFVPLWSRSFHDTLASTIESTTCNHLSFTINNKYLQLVQNNLLPHSFSCFHLNAHSHQLHRCSPRPLRPLHSAAWNGSVERQCGTAAWSAPSCCAAAWRTPRCRSMLQNAAGSDLSTGSVERQRGTAAWSAPTAALHAAVPCCRMQRGLTSALAAWNGSVERPRGVRQQPHSTRPFHAAECRGVWPQHWQRGTAAWNGRVECANSRTPRGRSMLQNAAGSDLSTGSVERQRGTAAWSAPTAALHAAVPCCRMQRGLTAAPQAMEAPPAADVHGRALLQEKFDDRRVVGPCCRKSHQRGTNWCVRLTRPLSRNFAAVCSRFNRCHKEVC